MKCPNCPHFITNACELANHGLFSQLEGDCLLRMQCILLRDILDELIFKNDEGEDWKYGSENNP